jgi:glucosylceramidase
MPLLRAALIGSAGGVLAVASAVLPAAESPAVAAAAAAPAVTMWLTTPDRSQLLTAQPASAIGPASTGMPSITVDPARTYQPIEGFGASVTDSAARVISASAARDAIMRDLFDRNSGIGLNFLRQPMGASDFVAGPHYTYDDVAPGLTDYELAHFSIDHDQERILPLLREARRLNPETRIMATPWSPPAWMKTGGSLIGGQLRDDDRVYRTYAQYFVRFLQAYAAAGVPVDAVSVQNEPQNRHPKQYPGTDLRPAHEARLIRTLGPALDAAGLGTKILAFDHNWALHPDDQSPSDPPDPDHAYTVLADAQARRYVDGVAFHCYYGDPSSQTRMHQTHPDLAVYFTECSGVRSTQPANTFRDTLRWQTRNLTIGAVRNWARTVVGWNAALDPSGGPHNGGCDVCTGVVTVDGAAVTRNAEYYVLGHASKFVRPGAVRIESDLPGNLRNVAFRNPDGSVVLLVLNDADSGDARFAVNTGRQSFSAVLPAGAVATFVQSAGGDAAGPITGIAGKCVAVAGGIGANGVALQLHTCTGAEAQRWTVGADGTLRALGRCADVAGGSTGNGAAVQLQACTGTGGQVWRPRAGGTLLNAHAGRCLDATDVGSADGTRLQVWDCHGGANQVWRLPA